MSENVTDTFPSSSGEFVKNCESIVREKLKSLFRQGETLAFKEIHDLCKGSTMESIMGDHRARYDEIMATKDTISQMCARVLDSLPFGKPMALNAPQPKGKRLRMCVGNNTYFVVGEDLVVQTRINRNIVPLSVLDSLWQLVSAMGTYNRSEICKNVRQNKGKSFVMNGLTIPSTMPHTANFGVMFFDASGLSSLRRNGVRKKYEVVGSTDDYKNTLVQIRRD